MEGSPQAFLIPDDGVHANEVNHAAKRIFTPQWQLHDQSPSPQTLLHHVNGLDKVCTSSVHLVDKRNSGHVILFRLTPYRLGLRLNPAHRTEQTHNPVQHPQAALYLRREVHMPRGIDNVNPVIIPKTRGRRRRNRDAPLLLLHHPIHRSRAIVDFANAMRFSRVIKNPFCRGRLTRINMCNNANITRLFQRN